MIFSLHTFSTGLVFIHIAILKENIRNSKFRLKYGKVDLLSLHRHNNCSLPSMLDGSGWGKKNSVADLASALSAMRLCEGMVSN
ncbi:MAG TPA: hypothetical protein VMZ49_10990, partial [Patescibacteria group bacterium]|nr:hypothetical protein [Patescibacteria group bacterium]